MSKLSVKKTAGMLLEKDDILILCHRYPDGDAIGSSFALCMALRSLGKRANVMCGDILPQKFSYIYDRVEPMKFREKFIVAVDVASASQLGVLEKIYADRVDLAIDHHSFHTPFAKDILLNIRAGAAGEIIFALLAQLGAGLTNELADALYTAVSTDTGCFRYSNTTADSHRIAAKLMDAGARSGWIDRLMFETKSRARIEMERRLYETLEFRENGRLAMMTLSRDIIDAAGATEGDIDGVSGMVRKIEGVEIGVLIRETEQGYKISARSVPPYDVAAVCGSLGGGGHVNAAGCTLRCIYDEARDLICEAAIEELNKSR